MNLLIVCAGLVAVQRTPCQTPVWSVSREPTLEIGRESEPTYEFNGITGVVRLRGGEIAVADSRSQEIRLFSAMGSHIRTLSRKGRGPGELQNLVALWQAGDTILALDGNSPKSEVLTFSAAGPIDRFALPRFGGGAGVPVGRFSDGRWAVAPGGVRAMVQGVKPPAIVDDSTSFATAKPGEDSSVSHIGAFINTQLLLFPSPVVPNAAFPTEYVFGHSTRRAVSGDFLWTGDTDSGEISLWNSAGQKVRTFMAPFPRRPVDATVVKRLLGSRPAEAGNRVVKAMYEALYSAPLPKFAPRFGAFIPGVDGEMWIQHYVEDPALASMFTVLDRSGRPVGSVSLRRPVRVFSVGRDYLLGVKTDADGVEHVAMYSVRRSR